MKDVFTMVEKEELDRAIWRKIGTAFENRDGSLNIFLDALPVNGKLQVRDRKKRDFESAQEP